MPDDAPTADPVQSTADPFATWVEGGAKAVSPAGYDLQEEIGRGGMGVVYRARDTVVGRAVAVKLLQDHYPATGAAARRFMAEARITGQLQHPGIPAVHQLGHLAEGRPFLAMKLIRGETLTAMLATGSDRGRLLAVFEKVCEAVGYAHSRGVIHRDLKPANVMVGAFGEVQVMDWGLAKVLTDAPGVGGDPEATADAATEIDGLRPDADQTQDGQSLGTPAFMPPEQAIGAVAEMDRRSDVFGLGAVLCVLLTGRPPYLGSDSASTRLLAARGRLEDAFGRLDRCGSEPDLVALCKRCLALEKPDRPADAGEVAAAVAALRQAADARARAAEVERERAAVREAEGRTRRRLLTAAGGLVLAVTAAGGLVAGVQWRRSAEQERATAAARDAAESERGRAESALRRVEAEQRATRRVLGTVIDTAVVRRVLRPGNYFRSRPDRTVWRDKFHYLERDPVDIRNMATGQPAAPTRNSDVILEVLHNLHDQLPTAPADTRQGQLDRAGAAARVAQLRLAAGNRQAAEERLAAAIDQYTRLLTADPTDPDGRRGLAEAMIDRGVMLAQAGRWQEAEAGFRAANGVLTPPAGGPPATPADRQRLAASYSLLWVVGKRLGRPGAGVPEATAARDLWLGLVAEAPAEADGRLELAEAHDQMTDSLVRAGRRSEAVGPAVAARDVWATLADAPRPWVEHRYGYLNASELAATLAQEAGDPAAARRILAAAEPQLRAAVRANPQGPFYWAWMRTNRLNLARMSLAAGDHATTRSCVADVVRASTALAAPGDSANPGRQRLPADVYAAAVLTARCVPLADRDASVAGPAAVAVGQQYADTAMRLLRHAAAVGWADAELLARDADLTPLRRRLDFRWLALRLQSKVESSK